MDEAVEKGLRESGLELAPLGRRTVAYAIDDMLVSLIFVVMLWDQIAAAQTPEAVAAIVNSVWLLILVTKIGYHTLFVWQYGASLGKMAMKIWVVEAATLRTPRFAVAFNRAIFRVVSEMVFYLGFLWAFFDPNRQAWHDKTAQTFVVNA
ncbi:RDD family protein [Hydrogenimonas sp.]